MIKKCNVDTIFLVFDRVLDSKMMFDEKISSFIKTKNKLNGLGFEVNAWLAPTIGYGNKSSVDNDAPKKYTRIVNDRGMVLGGAYCPLDKNFVEERAWAKGVWHKGFLEIITVRLNYAMELKNYKVKSFLRCV